MATFIGSGPKEPLVEPQTKAAIARRSGETIGLLLLALAGLSGALLFSYSPYDPSYFNATDEAARNWLGQPGAYLADFLHHAFGWAAWGLPIFFAAWGLRFVTHKGKTRIVSRIILAPFAIGVASVFAAAHAPLEGWMHDYGLGGWFGDVVLGGLLSMVPVDLAVSLKSVTVLLAIAMVLTAAAALGATMGEAAFFGAVCVAGALALFRGVGRGIGSALGFAGAKSAAAAKAALTPTPRSAQAERKTMAKRLTPSFGNDIPQPQSKAAEARAFGEVDGMTAEAAGNDEAIMARISAAVAKFDDRAAQGVDIDAPLDLVDEDAGYDADDEELDLPSVERAAPRAKDPAPTGVVQSPSDAAIRKSAAAKAEEQPRLALGDA